MISSAIKIGAVNVNIWKALCRSLYQIHAAESVSHLETVMIFTPCQDCHFAGTGGFAAVLVTPMNSSRFLAPPRKHAHSH
jgi:hypothetical protein